jgi:N-methylhydantoinase A
MNRIAVDIGGTFTDCFTVWDGRQLQSKALTTHHNLAVGFNEAVDKACDQLGIDRRTLLGGIDSVRYATTLGTNALIECSGPRVGLLITEGFESTVAISRGRGYAEGLPLEKAMDLPRATRPNPLVPPRFIRGLKERLDFTGQTIRALNEDHVRQQIRDLVDEGVEAIVVTTVNGTSNPSHERRIRELFLEEYPTSQLGSIPIILSSDVARRRGEYARTMTAIIDAYLHSTMYHGTVVLAEALRESGYERPLLLVHNTGGMAQLNSTDAVQTVHSGPVAGIHAGDQVAQSTAIGNIVTTDMGGTSFDIGIVVAGGIKNYDFNPVFHRWLVTTPMVHLNTLGSGGGSIARYDSIYQTVQVGPDSAGSDPGPACYDRGGLLPTVTDADLLLGHLEAEQYAGGEIVLNRQRSEMALEDLCDELDLEAIDVAKLIRRRVDFDMATGIRHELRARGYKVSDFTMLAYGGNGPLHCCAIARAAKIHRVLIPPYASVFSASGASSMDQMHFHEHAQIVDLFNPLTGHIYDDFAGFNAIVETLEQRGRADLVRQGAVADAIQYRLEVDMRYCSQRLETTVLADARRLRSRRDVLRLIEQLWVNFEQRFGEGSQAPESGVRIQTIRVASWVPSALLSFDGVALQDTPSIFASPQTTRSCHFPDLPEPLEVAVYDGSVFSPGVAIDGPAVVNAISTTYLVEPGWRLEAAGCGAVWLTDLNPVSAGMLDPDSITELAWSGV